MPANQPAPNRGRPYADAFQAYWDAGWRGVIPVRGKYPPPDHYTGAEGLYPSFADCHAWSESSRGADNIALRLPDTVLGIDVDNYDGKNGAATIFDCQMRWGELPRTVRSTSRDDGVSGISLYRIPSGLAWPGVLPGGGVELIRWDHRYCISWPSIHPKTFRVYRWFTAAGLVMISTVPQLDSLAALPQSWIDGLSRGEWHGESKPAISAGSGTWLLGLSGAEQPACARLSFLGKRLSGEIVTAGSRHDLTRDGVLDLVRKGEEGHPGIVGVLQSVGETFVLAVSDRSSKATAWSEFNRFVDGAIRIVAAKRRTAQLGDPCIVLSDPPWKPGDELPRRRGMSTSDTPRSSGTDDLGAAQGTSSSSASDAAFDQLVQQRLAWRRADREALRLLDEQQHAERTIDDGLDGEAFMAEGVSTATFRVARIMPADARIVLAAQHKAGKTTLMGNLIRSLCDGTLFLGLEVEQHEMGNVGLIDLEMNRDTLRRWLSDMNIKHVERFSVWPMLGRVRDFDIRSATVLQQWADKLRKANVRTLIIDCLKPILDQLDLNEHTETGKITTPLTELKEMAGIRELILVHHAGHNGERSRGDSALRGWPEVEWHLVRLADEPDKEADSSAPRFFKAYGRDVNFEESRLQYDPHSRLLSIAGQETRSAARETIKNNRLEAAVLLVVQSEPGILRGDVPARLRERGTGGRTASVVAAIDALVTRKMIKEQLGGRSNRSHWLYPIEG